MNVGISTKVHFLTFAQSPPNVRQKKDFLASREGLAPKHGASLFVNYKSPLIPTYD